ncbi:MAG: HAD family hydrolase [Anaerolineae bacterium]
MIAAVFDFDGTLIGAHVWQRLVRRQLRQHLNVVPVLAYLASHYAFYPVARTGLMSVGEFRRLWALHMPWIMAGVSTRRAASLFDAVVDGDLMPATRPAVLERLRWHQAQGHHTVILSGAFEPLLSAYGGRIRLSNVVGTVLESRAGRYTGGMAGRLCFGEGKVARLREYFDANSLNVDLGASYAYADSCTDLPILEAVGRPVAVEADEPLRRHAATHGWQTMAG